MTAPPNPVLADCARQAAEQHPARSPERRAAAWVFVILGETATLDAARRALPGIPDPKTRYDATRFLRLLAEQDHTATATERTTT